MRKTTLPRFGRRHISPIVVVCVAFLIVYWAIAGLVMTLDPFAVLPWGNPSQLEAHPNNKRFLIAAIAKNPSIDLLMIGSSTAANYTSNDLREAFPQARNPYNLSYGAARPLDRNLVVATVAKHSRAEKVIIWLDWAYALPRWVASEGFPTYLYDDSWFNKLRMVNEASVSAAGLMLREIPIFPTIVEDPMIKEDYGNALAEYKKFQSLDSREELSRQVQKYRGIIDRPGAGSCADLPAFEYGLLPQLQQWDKLGRAVDLIFSAYSPAFYYVRGEPGSGLKLADQLMLRRCAVRQTASLSKVRVIALDSDKNLTGRLENYKDPGHLFGRIPLNTALEDIAKGRFIINSENVERYLAELHLSVINYGVPSMLAGD